MRASVRGRAERATTVEERERERGTSTLERQVEHSMLARHKEAETIPPLSRGTHQLRVS
jgi:hypothetical protein